MKKIRINELARELEVKAHEILDRLPELGVTEKKTHSSSIDEDVAIRLRALYA
jgi:translation initiation factor IF-2